MSGVRLLLVGDRESFLDFCDEEGLCPEDPRLRHVPGPAHAVGWSANIPFNILAGEPTQAKSMAWDYLTDQGHLQPWLPRDLEDVLGGTWRP